MPRPARHIALLVLTHFITGTLAMAQSWTSVYYEFDGVSYNGAIETAKGTILLFGNEGTVARMDPNTKILTQLRGTAGSPPITCGAQYNGDTLLAFQLYGGTLMSTDQGATWTETDAAYPGTVNTCLRRQDGSILIVSDTWVGLLHADGSRNTFDLSVDDVHQTTDGKLVAVDRDGRVFLFQEADRTWSEVGNIGVKPLGITSIGGTVWILTQRALYSAEIADAAWTFTKIDYPGDARGDITCVSDTLIVSRDDGLSIYQYLSADLGATWFGGWTGPEAYGEHRFVEIPSGLMMVGPYGMYRYARVGRVYDSLAFPRNGIGIGRRPVLQKFFSHIDDGPNNTWFALYRSPGFGLLRSQPDGTWSRVNINGSGFTERYRDLVIGSGTTCVLSDSVYTYEVNGTWKDGRYWKVYIIDSDGNQTVARGDSLGDIAEGMTMNGRTLFLYGGGKLLKLNVDDLTLDTMDVPDPGYIQSMHAAQDGQIVYVGRQIGISIDNGTHWSFVNHPWPEGSVGNVHVFTDGRIFFARPIEKGDLPGVRVYTTDPPYKSWDSTMAMEGGWVWPFNIDANESGLMVIASRSGSVAISTDRGNTWTVEKPMFDDYAELPAVAVTSTGVIRVAGAPSLILETSRTTAHVDEWVTGGHANCEASWKRGTIEIPMQITTSATFAVYDLSGQAIAQGSAETVPSGLICRTPNALAPGLYLITVVDGATQSTCRLMVTE
jgi:hypothetical protein